MQEEVYTDDRGDLSFATNSKTLADMISTWSWAGDRHSAPRTIEELETDSFAELLKEMCEIARLDVEAVCAFPAEMAEEEQSESIETLDGVLVDNDTMNPDLEDIETAEETMLESLPLPGTHN